MIQPAAAELLIDPASSPPSEFMTLIAAWGIKARPAGAEDPFVLTWHEDERLCLRTAGQGLIRVDFGSPSLDYRRKFGGGRRQGIARAVGLKKGRQPFVLDATAGLGRDAFVLASLGCRVRMLERSPVLAALLMDGLERASRDPEIGDWVKDRLSLSFADSRAALVALPEAPDVVYLDPMFPEKKKSALVKKDMRALQGLLGGDYDAAELLPLARAAAKDRVVVKRPAYAPELAGAKPDGVIEAKKSRFDIYLTPRKDH